MHLSLYTSLDDEVPEVTDSKHQRVDDEQHDDRRNDVNRRLVRGFLVLLLLSHGVRPKESKEWKADDHHDSNAIEKLERRQARKLSDQEPIPKLGKNIPIEQNSRNLEQHANDGLHVLIV